MFTITDRPHMFPGRSLLGDTRGPVVDTGVDQNGWIYINRIEAIEIGRCFGLVEPEVYEQATRTISELQTELAQAIGRLADQQPLIEAVGRVKWEGTA